MKTANKRTRDVGGRELQTRACVCVSKHAVVMEPPGHFKHKTYKIHRHTARDGAQWNVASLVARKQTHRHMWMHVIGKRREKRKKAGGGLSVKLA